MSVAPAVSAPAPASSAAPRTARTKRIGWQGLTLAVPADWDVTGFSGDAGEGYLRIDDGDERGVEIKWATHAKRSRKDPDLELRADAYLTSLAGAARKKRQAFSSKVGAAPRGVLRPERAAVGFQWSGERRAAGAVFYCRESRRVVIVQVGGPASGGGGLGKLTDAILTSLECRDAEPGWRNWSLYDLDVDVPSGFALTGQQVMNVYVKLAFARGTERLTVEQWGVADVARRDAYLDVWLSLNGKGALPQMKVAAEESERAFQGHPAVTFTGRPALGLAWWQALKEAARAFKAPALRYAAQGWECAPGNKIYLVEHLRPSGVADLSESVAARLTCHGEPAERVR